MNPANTNDRLLYRFKEERYRPVRMAWSPDGSRFAISMCDENITVLDCNGLLLWNGKGEKGHFNTLAWSPDGRKLASGDGPLAWSPDGRWLATDRSIYKIYVWDAIRGQTIAKLDAHTNRTDSETKEFLNARFQSKPCVSIQLWDMSNCTQAEVLTGHRMGLVKIAWSPDGRFLLSGGNDRRVVLWDALDRKEIAKFAECSLSGHAWTFDGFCFYLLHGLTKIIIFALKHQQVVEISRLEGHTALITSVAWSLHHPVLITASVDTTIRLWDSVKGREIAQLNACGGGVDAMALSWDGACLASAASDNTIRLWDVALCREITQIGRADSSIDKIVFSPNGTRLAVSSIDGAVALWDVSDLIHNRAGDRP